ncbi:rhodanese-like domain-containing protein [Shewanella sp. D64]|uniref:rhodanese-like domain-containing protein n=1 Tax=unclassified Shewanella TaxID=196818 RepID=UPI0022BA2981|nr:MULTISPECIES: rhodanese-like domain-containing protein [unclassified Shewanella]MEC4725973.1 rhodanese-like domain-containing protein [Shewanella sp. D64]MEC4737228.1 rhodanese-like domain-containing protein [Shewanella sp. E94]WBJ93607.1 rhodanese-like domain-containing protein [Shewanella sp. MTB7]
MKFINKVFRAPSYLIFTIMIMLSVSQSSLAGDENPQIAWDKIDSGALIVDVRTAEEFAAGHLKNAINIPFQSIKMGLEKLHIDKDRSIVLYCRSGRRSGVANETLVKNGYSNTYNGGGYERLNTYTNK